MTFPLLELDSSNRMTVGIEKFQCYNRERYVKPQRIKIYTCLFQNTKFWKHITSTKSKHFKSCGFLVARWVLEETEIPIWTKPKGDSEKVVFSVAELIRTNGTSSLCDGESSKITEEKPFRKEVQV